MAGKENVLRKFYIRKSRGFSFVGQMENTLVSLTARVLLHQLHNRFGFNEVIFRLNPALDARSREQLSQAEEASSADDKSKVTPDSDYAADHHLSDDEWTEAAVAAMKEGAANGFVAPEQHLGSIRTLIKQATLRNV